MKTADLLSDLKKTGRKIFFAFVIVGLASLGVYLFIGDGILFNFAQKNNLDVKIRTDDEVLNIGYAFSPDSLEPTHFDQVTRNYLVQIYEGLVRTDGNLNIKPGLAVSWGLLDPLTWEFRLRPGVKFHNGKVLEIKDVIYSLNRAADYEDSQLKNLLNTIESVEFDGFDKIIIHTRVADPLLLNKLAVTLIFPDGYEDFGVPVGTGPYEFITYENGEMQLERNEEYFGPLPAFKKVNLKGILDKNERLAAFENGEIQLLANVPPAAACAECEQIQSENVVIKSIPSLEVSFLMFNLQNPLFAQHYVREALTHAFDVGVFQNIAFGFAKPSSQFVSSGVFGFDPNIEEKKLDMDSAKKMIADVIGKSFDRIVVVFDYPEGLDTIGQYVQSQLADLEIDVQLNPLSSAALQQKILSGESDFYFLGWRSELGDASDLLLSIAHSRDIFRGYGLYNGSNYMNKKVDQLIEASEENLDLEERLAQIQESMKIITDEDIIGVPLFESEIIFAYSKDLGFEPRVDGYVVASEIT